MIRILFVDDEPRVLRGLERMLTGADLDWETEYATSGRQALELLAQHPFDVVISDMRMPEMDGATLLEQVKQRHPDVVRIILSGHSERGLVLRAVEVTHRFLAKPCELEELQRVVTQAMALRRVLADTALRQLVSRLDRVPSMPEAYRELTAQIQTPTKTLKDMGAIIARDVGMTAKILQIVNSAFFGLPRHVPDPGQAVCLLGLDVLKALVMTVHVFSELAPDGIGHLGLGDLWSHSTETGAIAKRIASLEDGDRETCDHALMAGLLHDTGRLVLAANETRRYRKTLDLAKQRQTSLLAIEREVFGTTHAEVGAYLLGLWGLPGPTVEAVAFHHRPNACANGSFTALTAVHVADCLCRERHASDEMPTADLDVEYLARLGMVERVAVWRAQCLPEAVS